MAKISTGTQDNEGITHLLSDNVLDIVFVEIESSSFANPDPGYTGYAADGFWYTNGDPDPSHTPYKASWATEGEGDADSARGTLDRFPDRITVMTTDAEVVIFDADTLDVWMRFTPFDGTSSYNYGSAAGDDNIDLRGASFSEGYLVIATSKGARVIDFREDRMFCMGEAAGSQQSSANSISSRNSDGSVEAGGAYGGGSEDILHDSCFCVDVGVVGPAVSGESGGFVVSAVGTAWGLVGMVLLAPGVSSPRVINHVNFKSSSIGDWEAVDDGDGDATTPYVQHSSNPDAWDSNHVRIGDVVRLLPAGTEVTVEAIAGDVLTVTPEIDHTLSGSDCESERSVLSVQITRTGGLLFANGQQLVTLADDDNWYLRDDSGSDEGFADPRTSSGAAKVILTHERITDIHRVRYSGSAAYIATDQGVFVASASTFEESSGENFAPAELRYAAEGSALDPTYAILVGDPVSCYDAVVDPETGNLLVAAVDADAEVCVVTEIDTTIHQAFQFFDETDLGGLVTCLASYRNPDGPPDDESGVA